MSKLYRAVIDEDLNNFDPADYQAYEQEVLTNQARGYTRKLDDFPTWAKGQLWMAKNALKDRTYKNAPTAKGQLTQALYRTACKGWVEEGTVEWKKI